MKITNFKTPGSKAAKLLFTVCVLTLAGLSACKKDASTTSATVTEADAVQLTSDAVAPSTGGMSAQTTSSVNIYTAAAAPGAGCGATKDTTIAATLTGSNYTFSYSLSWNYIVNCASQVATLNYTGSSNYSGPFTTTSGSCIGTDVLTGIASASDTYALTGSFERKGNATSKVGQQKSFTSDLKIATTNAQVSKTTLEIVSGTATVTLTGATSGGKSFSFGGTLTFLGNKKGTLVLNSGTTYNIAWN